MMDCVLSGSLLVVFSLFCYVVCFFEQINSLSLSRYEVECFSLLLSADGEAGDVATAPGPLRLQPQQRRRAATGDDIATPPRAHGRTVADPDPRAVRRLRQTHHARLGLHAPAGKRAHRLQLQ